MKKILFLSLIAVLLFAGCKKNDDTSITNNGSSTITIALQGKYQLNVTSDKALTYTSDNTLYVTVSSTGIIFGKNVGEANITVSNDSESITIHINVDLFIQPTLDFTSSKAKIKSLYGEPRMIFGDTTYTYGGGEYTSDWVSYSCWRMNFFFDRNERYIESDVSIRKDCNFLLDKYIDENFYPYDTLSINDTMTYYRFLNAPTEEASTVIMGKIYEINEYHDILLYYNPFEKDKKDNNLHLTKKSKVSCDGIRL